MVVTRAQASTSRAGEPSQRIEQQEVSPPAPPSPPPHTTQPGQLATLTQQVQALVATVHELQEQHSVATQQQPRPLSPYAVAAQASRQSTSGRSPQQEDHRRYTSPKHHRHEVLKRPRSPAHRLSNPSLRRQRGKEPEWGHRHRHRHHPSYSSSESSGKGSIDGHINRRAERCFDEYHRRLEELSRRLTNQSEVDYDSRPILTRRIIEEPIPSRFCLPQLDPYYNTTDLLDYLKSYKALMQVQGATDAFLCIAFPATL